MMNEKRAPLARSKKLEQLNEPKDLGSAMHDLIAATLEEFKLNATGTGRPRWLFPDGI
jgi:hypothetical protein